MTRFVKGAAVSKQQYLLRPDDGAEFSPCYRYRYRLWRDLGDTSRRCCFIMLNPSTATADTNDPTVRRCIGYARAWGFGALDVLNVYAWRSTDPDQLVRVDDDPTGDPENIEHIVRVATRAELVVAAWGAHRRIFKRRKTGLGHRDDEIRCALGDAGVALKALGLSAEGYPFHPLYQPADAQLVELP